MLGFSLAWAAADQATAAGALVSTMIYYLGQNEYVFNLAVTNIDDASYIYQNIKSPGGGSTIISFHKVDFNFKKIF